MDNSTNPQNRGSRLDLYPSRPPEESPPTGGGSAAPATGRPRRSPRRRHPANSTRAAALALSLATTGGLAYTFAVAEGTVETDLATSDTALPTMRPTTTVPAVTPETTSAASEASTVAPELAPTEPEAPVAPTEATYVGESVSTKWGPVQVEVTVVDGQLADVVAVQIPDGDRRSVSISSAAEPQLRSVALASQSSDVDTVSGATYTSAAYAESLQSAIDRAAVDGIVIGLP
jgi:uncharacterized protein with FMN-binding domain